MRHQSRPVGGRTHGLSEREAQHPDRVRECLWIKLAGYDHEAFGRHGLVNRLIWQGMSHSGTPLSLTVRGRIASLATLSGALGARRRAGVKREVGAPRAIPTLPPQR